MGIGAFILTLSQEILTKALKLTGWESPSKSETNFAKHFIT